MSTDLLIKDLARSGLTPGDVPHFKGLEAGETRRFCMGSGDTEGAAKYRVPSYQIPYHTIEGKPLMADGVPFSRLRFLCDVRQKDGKTQRYFTPGGLDGGCHVYIPPRFAETLKNSEIPVVFVTEGEKKAESACKAGIPCLALPGIWMFQDQQAKARMLRQMEIELGSTVDAGRMLQNNPDIPLISELLDVIQWAKTQRPLLQGAMVMYDSDGCPFDEKEIEKIQQGKLRLPDGKRLDTWAHPVTHEIHHVLNRQVAGAAWLLAESLRRQLPGNMRLPVLHGFCPHVTLLHDKDKGDNDAAAQVLKNGLDDWIVYARDIHPKRIVPTFFGHIGMMIIPLRKMNTLLEKSHLFGARIDPMLLDSSRKNAPSPDVLFRQMLDKQYLGNHEGVLYLWGGREAALGKQPATHWQPVSDRDLSDSAGIFLDEVYPAKGGERALKSICYYANATPETFDIPEPARNPVRVAVQDGVVEVIPHEGMKLIDGDRSHGLRHCVNAKWADREQPTPLWDKFIQTILPDAEIREVVLGYIGYTLMADTRFQTAQFWIGSGANGKGVLGEIAESLHRKHVSVDMAKLSGFGTESIIGASLVSVDEMAQKPFDEQKFKTMVSGDEVSIERKFKTAVTLHPTAKWIVRGNLAPAISDQTDGFWRRLQVVPFEAVIPVQERDGELAKKIIENELSGVLYQVLQALQRRLEIGHFGDLPEKMLLVKQAMRAETNTVIAWLEDADMVQVGEGEEWEPGLAVHASYKNWCELNGYKNPYASKRFWSILKIQLPWVDNSQRRYISNQDTGAASRHRVCNVRMLSSVSPDHNNGIRSPASGNVHPFPLKNPPKKDEDEDARPGILLPDDC